mgnify:CR=1 FL=1
MGFIAGLSFEPEDKVRRECMDAVVSGQKANLTQGDLTRMSQERSRDERQRVETAFERHAFGYNDSITPVDRQFFYDFKEEAQYARYSRAVAQYNQVVCRWNTFMRILYNDVNAGTKGELNLSKKQLLVLTKMLDAADVRGAVGGSTSSQLKSVIERTLKGAKIA